MKKEWTKNEILQYAKTVFFKGLRGDDGKPDEYEVDLMARMERAMPPNITVAEYVG
jgi:hypothetical protein